MNLTFCDSFSNMRSEYFILFGGKRMSLYLATQRFLHPCFGRVQHPDTYLDACFRYKTYFFAAHKHPVLY